MTDLTSRKFPGARIKLERASAAGKLGGFLIWEGLVGQDQIERQWAVRHAIHEGLDGDEQLQVSGILAMTPDELKVMSEG